MVKKLLQDKTVLFLMKSALKKAVSCEPRAFSASFFVSIRQSSLAFIRRLPYPTHLFPLATCH